MAFFFNKNELDVSTPSNFGKSIRKNKDKLDAIFDSKVWIEINKKSNSRAYMEEVEDIAISGNPQCQEMVVQWCMEVYQSRDNPESLKFILRKAIEFGTMAANSGITREALNLPVSLGRLSHMLTEESGGVFTDEIEHLSREMYRWSLFNSQNIAIPKSKRDEATKTANKLYESMPEMYSGI